jgi:hypothetical protein
MENKKPSHSVIPSSASNVVVVVGTFERGETVTIFKAAYTIVSTDFINK